MNPESITPWQQLLQHLRSPQPAVTLTSFCEHCQTVLPLFVSDELAGRVVDIQYPEIAHHLDLCPVCLAEYEALSRLAVAALYGEESA